MSKTTIRQTLFDRAFFFYNALIFFVFSHIAFFYLYPLFLEAEGATKTKIGIVMGLFPAGTVISRPLMGWLVEKIGEKKVLVGGLFIIFISGFLYIIAREINFFLYGLRSLHGIGFSAFIASSFTGISWRIPAERRGEAFGFVGAVILLAIATMPLMGEYLIKWKGFSLLFQVEGVFALCGFFLALLFMPGEIVLAESSSMNSFTSVLKKKSFLAVLVITVFFVQGQATVLNFIALMAESVKVSSGRFLGVAATIAIFCRLFVARSIDKYNKKNFTIFSFIIFAIGLVLVPGIKSTIVFFCCTILYGAGMGLLYPLMNVLAVDQANPEEMPVLMTIFTGVFDAGFITGSVLSGWLADQFSLSWIFYFGAAVATVGAFLTRIFPLDQSLQG
ncbi:MAG: hypothetical protein DRG83_01100 [Deltaproteobacteria bacterium]|nr:MAG: hypothetical protein DRG83_01100 [Deltaproteobacteria bacterium]